MCRLFGLLSTDERTAAPWLVSAESSLLVQAKADAERRQGDGWGLAWYESLEAPRIEKGIGGAYEPEEIGHYTHAAHRARGPLVIGHLRAASNPLNLPREALVSWENSQPFSDGSLLFAHNGWIGLPRENRRHLGEYARSVKGVNDSEVYFHLLRQELDRGVDPREAYVASVRRLHHVWVEAGRPAPGPHGGLNILLSRSPGELWAFCHYSGDHGGCLTGCARPYYEMTYHAERQSVVVGSEPFDRREEHWQRLPAGQFLRAVRVDGHIEVTTGAIENLPAFPEIAPPSPRLVVAE